MLLSRSALARLATGAILVVSLLSSSCSRPEVQGARYLERGKRRIQARDFSRAVLDLRNAVRLVPKSAEARYQLGLAQMGVGDISGAAASFRRATQLNPSRADARVMLAQILAGSPDRENLLEAEEVARGGLAASGGNADLMSALAYIEARLGKPEQAERRLQETLSRFPRHLGALAGAARLKLARNDIAGAEKILRKAAELDPPVVPAIIALGDLYAKTGRRAEAGALFSRAVALQPDSSPALIGLAELRIREGREDEAERTLRRIPSNRDNPYRFLHANFLLASGSQDQAVAELQALFRRDPGDRDARTQLVSACAQAGRTAEASRILAEALERNPKDAEALLQRAVLSLTAGDYDSAQRDMDQFMRFRRDSPLAHFVQARIHRARSALKREQQSLMDAVRFGPDFLPARLALADNLLAERSYKAALEYTDSAPPDQRNDPALAARRNWALVLSGDARARAAVDASKTIAKMPDFLLQDALLKARAGDHAGARAALEEVLAQDPENVRAAELLAQSYISQQQAGTAVEKTRLYASRAPRSARMQYLLGRVLAAAGRNGDARRAFESAGSLDAHYVQPDLALAGLDIREGAFAAAKRRLAAVIASNPSSSPAHLLLGQIEEQTGNFSAAIDCYRKTVVLDPDSFVAANNLAYLLVNFAHQPDEGLKHAQHAKRLAPENPAVDDTIGWALYHKGLFTTAIAHLEAAAAGQKSAVRQFHLAMAYFKAGDKARARAALESGLRLDARVPEAAMARELIGQADPPGN